MENTSSFSESRYRYCKANQISEPFQSPSKGEGIIPVRLRSYWGIATKYRLDRPYVWNERRILKERRFWFHLPSLKLLTHRSKFTQIFVDCLSGMCVPEDQHPTILEKIFDKVDVAVSPEVPLEVSIWDTILRVPSRDAESESMETFRPNLIPATCSIQALEKVRYDSLTTGPPLCAICMEDFGADDDEQLITRLPCSHYFHGDCVVHWLEISHLCPLCRYPMPTVPSNLLGKGSILFLHQLAKKQPFILLFIECHHAAAFRLVVD